MKCINVKCEGKPAYDIVIESGFGGLSEAFNKLEITGRKLCVRNVQRKQKITVKCYNCKALRFYGGSTAG